MNSLQLKIDQLNKCLQKYCQPMYERILKPLTENEIDRLLEIFQISDPIIRELYQLTNGIAYEEKLPTSAFDFSGFGVIPSLEYINTVINIDTHRIIWPNKYIPLISSFQGDFLLFDSKSDSSTYGQLFLHSPSLGYVDFKVGYFDSFYTMVDTITESFTSKAFIYDNHAMFLESDYEKHFEIAKRLNPNSEYWAS